MQLCNDKHDEVCYEGRICPACEVREELQEKIDALKEELEEAQAQIP